MRKLAVLALTGAVVLGGRPGALDRTFGVHGKLTTKVGVVSWADTVAVQRDGKIVVAGWSGTITTNRFTTARYLRRGILDRSFGSRGIVRTSFGGTSVVLDLALQRDGKILAVGYASADQNNIALARYNRDGSLDRSFGRDGKVTTRFATNSIGRAVAVQADGKIVVSGNISGGAFALVRYRPNGSLDRSFGTGGRVTTDFSPESGGAHAAAEALAIQRDGKIVAGGEAGGHETTEIALARYRPNGSLDPTFGSGGIVTAFHSGLTTNSAEGLRPQPDGNLVVGGGVNGSFALFRLRRNGSFDPSFGETGGVTLTDVGIPNGSFAFGMAVQRDGKFVLAGNATPGRKDLFALARFDRDGLLDPGFRPVTTSISRGDDVGYDVALAPDGRIVVAGTADENGPSGGRFAVVRYLATG